MSRFDRLEFLKSAAGQAPDADSGSQLERDETFYCDKAGRALGKGDTEASLRYYSRALGRAQGCAEAWVGQLRCLLMLGEFEEACVWADRALNTLPDHPDVLAAKAAALGRLNQYSRGIALSDLSIKNQRDKSWFVWWARGDLLIEGSFDKARFCFEKAVEMGDREPVVLMEIGRSFLSAKLAGEAIEYLRRANESDHGNPAICFYLGLALGLDGNRKGAIDAVERCLRNDPSSQLREQADVLLNLLRSRMFIRRAIARLMTK